MILRRLSQSLKEQNWTAIAIEFVLLVIGVFLGIQVANWNAERETRQKSVVFTERLKNELRNEGLRKQRLIAYYREVRSAAEAAAGALSGEQPLSNDALLINAYRATQYWQAPRQCATYNELVSTGGIGLITDRQLMAMAHSTCGDLSVENMRRDRDESPYRALFRMSVPNDLQRVLAERCGDRIAPGQKEHFLDYACDSGLDSDVIDTVVSALIDDPQTLRLLRLRLADIDTQLSDVSRNNQRLLEGLADGQNEIEAVELDRTLDFPLSLNLNCQGFLDSCLGPQLPVFKDVFGVEGDVLFGGLEQLGDFKLGQPDGLAVDAQVEPGAAVVRGVQDEFAHGATPNCLRIFRRATSVSLASASMTSSSPTISAMGRYVSASEVWI